MAEMVRLTVVPSQGEADIVCGLLRAHGIPSYERPPGILPRISTVPELTGAWREVLVSELDLYAARAAGDQD